MIKRSKRRERKGLNALPEGEILNIVIQDEYSQEDEGFECNGIKESIKFNNVNNEVCAECTDGKVEDYSSSFLNDIYLLVLYAQENAFSSAYFYRKKTNSILFFELYEGSVSVQEREVADMDPEDVAEAFFRGKSNNPIDKTPEEIRKEFQYESKTKEWLFVFALLLVAGITAYFIFFGDTKKVVRQPPPRPAVIPLTHLEKSHISRAISLKVIEAIEKEVSKYKKNHALYDLRRIVGFSISRNPDIPPVEPYLNEELNIWEYPEGPRRGAVEYQISKTTQQVFPGVGYIFVGEDIYSKDHTRNIMFDENFLLKNKSDLDKIALTEKCLKDILYSSENVQPKKRDLNDIKIDIIDINMSTFVTKIKPIIQRCPILLDSIEKNNEKIRLGLTIYRDSAKVNSAIKEGVKQ